MWSWQLKIELLDVNPTVWRRVVVPETITLATLHRAFQVTLGWRDMHPHEFIIGGKRYGGAQGALAAKFHQADERRTYLARALGGEVRCFDYIYDFCGDWHHVITAEQRRITTSEATAIRCSGGENASPPEDIGSAHGYAAFLSARLDPTHVYTDRYLAWVDTHFDPSHFDLQGVNFALSKLTAEDSDDGP